MNINCMINIFEIQKEKSVSLHKYILLAFLCDLTNIVLNRLTGEVRVINK